MQMNAWDKVYFFENHVKNIYVGILHFSRKLDYGLVGICYLRYPPDRTLEEIGILRLVRL